MCLRFWFSFIVSFAVQRPLQHNHNLLSSLFLLFFWLCFFALDYDVADMMAHHTTTTTTHQTPHHLAQTKHNHHNLITISSNIDWPPTPPPPTSCVVRHILLFTDSCISVLEIQKSSMSTSSKKSLLAIQIIEENFGKITAVSYDNSLEFIPFAV